MTMWLKQSTAVTVKLGPFVDATDGVTAMTALTIAQADIRLSKNGGNIAQSNNAAGATHDELGYYDVPLDTTDTNTLGTLWLGASESGALPVWQHFMVVPANVWDSLFGADKLQVHVDEMTAGIITATGIADGAIDAATFATGAITAAAIAADAVAEIADAVWDEATSGHVAAGSFGEAVGDLTAAITTTEAVADAIWDEATSGHATAGTFGQVLQPIRAATAQAGAAGTITLDASASATDDLYNGAWVVLTGGTGVGQARLIYDYVGSSKVATIAPNWITNPSSDSVFVIIPATFVHGALSLGAGAITSATFGSGAITASAIAADAIGASELAADAITEIQSGLATAASVAALNNLSAAQVNAEVDTALADIHLDHLLAATYDPASKPGAADALLNELVESDAGVARFTANALEQAPSGGGGLTAADIADAVWEEAISDHSGTTGSTAEALNAAGAAGDPWTTVLPGAYGANSAGNIIGNNLNATVSSRATQTSVDDVPTNAELATALGTADDAVLSAIAALNNLSAAQVNAEVDTALADYDAPTKAELDAAVAPLATAAALATVDTVVDTIATYLDTEVAAIKAKTDNLPADPADASDIATATTTIAGYIDTEVASILAAVDTEVAAIKTVTDALTSAAAAKLALSAGTIVAGAAVTGTLSTTAMTTDLTEATNDHYNGRIIIWTSGVLTGQATDITDYDGATKMLTFTAITEAPSNGDDFVIV